jgi:integrase
LRVQAAKGGGAETEVLALMRVCSQRAPTGIRNRALIAVLWRSGLRISEALELERRDVDLDAGTLRVRHGKGDRAQIDSSYVRRLLPGLASTAADAWQVEDWLAGPPRQVTLRR